MIPKAFNEFDEAYTSRRVVFHPKEMSLITVCTDCRGKCCIGRTMVAAEERDRIIALTGQDYFVPWAKGLFYLERGPCPYLKNGLCSVQEIKPYVCQIFPFVPRVDEGELWLFCVGECDAASRLPLGFTEKARRLSQEFFGIRHPKDYAEYWNQNKGADFDDACTVFKVPVFDSKPERANG